MEGHRVDESLELDREILIAILARRYGMVSDSLQRYIRQIDDESVLMNLIRKVGEACDWQAVVSDFKGEVKSH